MKSKKKTRLSIWDVKSLSTRKALFNDKNNRINDIKARVLIKQKNGEIPMKADMVRLQQYKQEREALQETSENLSAYEKRISTHSKRL
jgi:hypothetical protein